MKKTIIILSTLIALASCSKAPGGRMTQEEALGFLYRYMPLPDKVDHDTAFYRRNVAASFQAMEEMPWGAIVPQREFKHFVLPVRVNNENLDESRMVFYAQLRDRVKNLSMQEAILEVNHWCHERVTYTPSDERTSSPLATVKTAYGRCGEESTFTVAALRSVGIPARQVYTPRWAHTDDNHAWVEAWADGEWHFLGACEPEAVLDLGWFNAPASRGMLMHTKAFGDYDGPEEVIARNACYTEINVTRNYAPVGKAFVRVVDTGGNSVEGADVEFKIYNYAEFYTVSRKKTDANGVTSLEAGMGDLLAWGHDKGGDYGFARCSAAGGDTALIVLDKKPGGRYSASIDIVPPAERNTLPQVSEQQREENARRLALEDSMRNAYVATFDTSTGVLKKSRGNHTEIKTFLQEGEGRRMEDKMKLLEVVSDKDLRDITSATLCDFLDNTPGNTGYPCDFYYRYVMNPRVANEMIVPHRAFFNSVIGGKEKKAFGEDVNNLVAWIDKNIAIDTVNNPQNLRMSPVGVWKARLTDAFSRNIFFVSVCRSLGIAARIDPVTQKVQCACEDCKWNDIHFGSQAEEPAARQGLLRCNYSPTRVLANPKYYSHFSLSAINGGSLTLMNYGEEDTYESLLRDGTQLDAGDYLLVTGTRMANGSVLAQLEIFPVAAHETTVMPLAMRHDSEGLQVIGSLDSESLYKEIGGEGVRSILSTTGRGYFVIAMIAPNDEPTNHVLRDIALYKDELEAWGRKIVLIFRNQGEAQRFNPEDFPALPSNVIFGIDKDGGIAAQMQGTLPVVKIADTFNRVVFESQGYTIGMGETLMKAVNKL